MMMDVETEEGLARRYSMHFRVKAGKRVRERERERERESLCCVYRDRAGVCAVSGFTV